MIPARIRVFSFNTIIKVTGASRTTLWRRRKSKGGDFPNPLPGGGTMGEDVLHYLQAQRTKADLPPLSQEAEADVLNALVAVEDAPNAKHTADQQAA